MIVTNAMVDAALDEWMAPNWRNAPRDIVESARWDMHATLLAALIVAPDVAPPATVKGSGDAVEMALTLGLWAAVVAVTWIALAMAFPT